MNTELIQAILTLQQLKLKDKTIETILSTSDSQPIELKSLFELCNKNSDFFMGMNTLPSFNTLDRAWNIAKDIIQSSIENNVKILSRHKSEFPALLNGIPNSPLLLHVKGNILLLKEKSIAIVGTRNPTGFGEGKALEVSEALANEGYTIVSGLATGVDTAAHTGALKANGHTIAVLAHGLQMIYPAANKGLAQKILDHDGALVSEYPWNTTLEPWKLIQRDRIQSGLSLGVFVIETGIKGGTMHTVNFCKKQNRVLIVLQHPSEWDRDTNTWGNKELIKKFESTNKFIVYRDNSDYHEISEKLNVIYENALNTRIPNDFLNVARSNELITHSVQEPVSGPAYTIEDYPHVMFPKPKTLVKDTPNRKGGIGKSKKTKKTMSKSKAGDIPKDQTTF